jgi:hypothetical protein
MKKPALYFTLLFVSIIGSTVLVSTTISSICKSFYKNDTEKSINVKTVPADSQLSDLKQVNAKL